MRVLKPMETSLSAVQLATEPGLARPPATPEERFQVVAQNEVDFLWRLLRRFGLGSADAEDAAQEVLLVLCRRIGDVAPGKERAFLVGTAIHVAANHRRAVARRHESFESESDQRLHPGSDPEALASERQRLALLEDVLAGLDWDLRVPFVLFELEELTMTAIASLLGIPMGTVASRLKRAREEFHARARRLRAQHRSIGAA